MPQFGGKDSKRHFTVVMGNKEHGLYISSTPSSAAKKAVTKLCTANKSKKVEFHIREITQGSKKKTYGPYEGYIEKLKEPIELKGRVIKYKPVAKLSKKTGVKKGGAGAEVNPCFHYRTVGNKIRTTALRIKPSLEQNYVRDHSRNLILLNENEPVKILEIQKDPISKVDFGRVEKDGVSGWVRMNYILQNNSNDSRVQCIFNPKLGEARKLWEKSLEPAPRRPILPNINNSLLNINSPKREKPNIFGTKGQAASFSGYQGQAANFSGLRRPAASFSGSPGQAANFSGLGRQAANFSGLGRPAANFSEYQGQAANFSEYQGQAANFSGSPGQAANFSGLGRPAANFSGLRRPAASILSTNIQVPEKLYNSKDNLELLYSIGGHIIQNAFIPKGQVVEVLETVSSFGEKYNKIRAKTSVGQVVEGFVESINLKKTRWLCDHSICLKFNGPYDKDQVSNKNIPVTVANILRNDRGEILVGTETDEKKFSEFNKTLKGYHLCAGKIDPGSCPVNSSYDETAEESRFLRVERDGNRDFRSWNAMFKPGGNYRMEPWVSSGRAIVFVGEIGNTYWDESKPPYGEQKKFTNPNQLDYVFNELRRVLPNTSAFHKYKEKINFKWVNPLPFGSSKTDWDRWSRDNQMFGWGKSIIQNYVERSAQPAQAQPLHNFSRQSTFLHGMPAPLPEPNYSQDLYFDSQIILLINKQIRNSETSLNDLLELCKTTYYKIFQNQIPQQKLSKLRQYILSQFAIKNK